MPSLDDKILATAPFIPKAVDRFIRPRRDDAPSRHALIWLAADDAIAVDAIATARACRTDRASTSGDALDDALARAARAAVDASPRGSLAQWLRTLIDDAMAEAPFPVASAAIALQGRLVEHALHRCLEGVARHGVLTRQDLSALNLTPLDTERLFQALRVRVPRPDLASLLASDALPLVVRDEVSPPTAVEVRLLREEAPSLVPLMLSTSSIPDALPEIDAVATHLATNTFADVDGIFVQHILGTQVPTLKAMINAGLDPARVTIVGVPYSTSEVAAEALRQLGFVVVTPELPRADALEEVSARALESVLATHLERRRRSPRPLLILDDGAKAAAMLHQRHPDFTAVHIVEQTARGVTVLAALERIRWPVVDVARSLQKGHEQNSIGREIVDAVVRDTGRVGLPCREGIRAVVLGAGVIGTGVARAFGARGCDVVVWDVDGGRRAKARAAGFVVPEDRTAALRDAEVVVGAAGATSVWAADLALLKPGCVLASASSRNIEIDLSPTRDPLVQVKTLVVEGEGGGRFATTVWRLADKDIVLLHQGFPMNFDGRVETGTNASIAPTRALMLAGAAQALGERQPGIHALRWPLLPKT